MISSQSVADNLTYMNAGFRLISLAVVLFLALLLSIAVFFERSFNNLAISREKSFLSLQICLMQLEYDKSELLDKADRIRSFNELITTYSGLGENEWTKITYDNRKFVPAIRFDPEDPMRIYETTDYPVGIFRSDRLEVRSNDFVVRWVKSGKIVKPS